MESGGDNRGPAVLAVTLAMIAFATIFVFFRLVSRIGVVRKMSADDWFMILAWVIAFGLSFSICYGTKFGLGRHEKDVLISQERPLKICQYVFTVLYNPALMATKTSILVFYLKISQEQRIFRWASILTLVIVNLAGIALTFLNVFQCRPVGAALETPVPSNAQCIDVVSLYLSSAPVNISTDLAILFLPMPILTSMNLPRKQKAILVITFGFGVFVTIVDVIRIVYLENAALTRLSDVQADGQNVGNNSRNQVDYSWYSSLSFMWSAVEVNVGIMCACVPALKPLVTRFMPRFLQDADEPEYKGGGPATSVAAMKSEMGETERIPSMPDSPPAARPASGGDTDEPIGFMNFLTTTDMDEMPEHLKRTTTAMTNTTRYTRPNTPTFFDFVNMKGKKPMVQMSARESYFPVAMVTLLFFLWGFAYGLLDVLNSQFQAAAHMTTGQSIGIHCAYFGGYLVGPLTFGRLVLKHWGFKACYIVGLVIYAIGTLVFWPSAVLTSFPAFLVSNLIVGLGLSTLEIAANAFVALCGPAEYGEIRLNLSQGTQACGTVVAPLLASKVLFDGQNASSLIDVQWTYLGIALFSILLAVVYFYVPLPEASDAELEDAAERVDRANTAQVGGIKVIWLTLGLGVFSQFCYVGGQEAVSTSFAEYMRLVDPGLDAVNHGAVGHTAFALGRFTCAFINFFIKPRYTLLFCFFCAVLFSALAMNFHGATPAALIIIIYFFEGPIFPLVYAVALRGLGRFTKDGSVLLTAAISGGAMFPPLMYAAQKSKDVQYAFCVVVAAFAFGAIFAVYLTLIPQARKQVDPVKNFGGLSEDTSPPSPPSPGSSPPRRESIWENLKRRRKESEDLPSAEHKERKSTPSPHDSPAGVDSLDFITSAA